MSTEAFRSALFADLEAWRVAYDSTLTVETENGPPADPSTLQVWVCAELRFYGANVISPGTRPIGRHTGTLSLQVYYREGEGTKVYDEILDSLQEQFRSRRIGGGVLKFGQRTIPVTALGFVKAGLLIPFYLDVF